MRGELAKFGGIRMLRVVCPDCGGWALVTNGLTRCCEVTIKEGDVTVERIVSEGGGRAGKRTPHYVPAKVRAATLQLQGWACGYCGIPFYSELIDNDLKKIRTLRITWDHFTPWVFSRSHQTEWVAACQICNGMKSSKIYETVQAVKDDLRPRWVKRFQPYKIRDDAGTVSPAAFHLKPPALINASAPSAADGSTSTTS
jgi:hypothetical protein